jgi:hypothetical protein
LLDLLLYLYEKGNFSVKMPSCKLFARLVSASSLVLFCLASSAMADLIPIDPHALFATGGDAVPIGSGQPITLSPSGGGIFVFNNDTTGALSKVDVSITLPDSFLNGFSFTGTIFTPTSGAASVTETTFTNTDCVNPSSTNFCVQMAFRLSPGPLVPLNGNFVLDFDAPDGNGDYQGVDALVANGTYTGDGDDSAARVGEWAPNAVGFVTPIVATPEPRQYAGLLAGIFALAIFLKRKRYAGVNE